MEKLLQAVPRGDAERGLYNTMCALMSGYISASINLEANCRPRERTDHRYHDGGGSGSSGGYVTKHFGRGGGGSGNASNASSTSDGSHGRQVHAHRKVQGEPVCDSETDELPTWFRVMLAWEEKGLMDFDMLMEKREKEEARDLEERLCMVEEGIKVERAYAKKQLEPRVERWNDILTRGLNGKFKQQHYAGLCFTEDD